MPEHLQLSPAFTAVRFASSDVLIRTEGLSYTRIGGIFADILERVQRPVDRGVLAGELGQFHPEADIRAALADLEAIGAVGAPVRGASRAEAAFRALVPVPRGGAATGLEMVAGGESAPWIAALAGYGVSCSAEAEAALVITDDYLRPGVAEAAARCRRWLPAKAVGRTLWLGPLMGEGEAACWDCVTKAMRPHRWQAVRLAAEGDWPADPSLAEHPVATAAAIGLVATAAAVWVETGSHPELGGAILTLDLATLGRQRHVVRPRADCPRCGGRLRLPVKLADLVSPITGIVSRTEPTAEPVYGLFHAQARFIHPLPEGGARARLRPRSSIGKSFCAAEATAAATAEAAERYSITYRGDERVTMARLGDLPAIAPNELLLYSPRQYANREAWNRTQPETQWVHEPFDPECVTGWTAATSLATGETRYVPAACCYMWYPFRGEPCFCAADTNGCAAGRTRDEAILHALLELIERDAVAIWWYNRLERPAVELASFEDGRILALRDELARVGREVQVLDLTTDLGIAAYAAVVANRDGSQPCFGCAAHHSPRAAALKAIEEAIQVRFWLGQERGDDALTLFLARAHVERERYLAGRSMVTAPGDRLLGTAEAIEVCVGRCRAAGVEPHWLDLTRPEVGVPVVRVVAPGLRHFWARLAPGRLYEVPQRMGWLAAPMAEEELNPDPCLI